MRRTTGIRGRTGMMVRAAAMLTAVVTAGMVTVLHAHAASRVAAAPQVCSVPRTASSESVCRIMPTSGMFSLPIPGTHASLFGVGTPDRAGKPIVLSRAALVCKSLGGIGISINTPRSAGLLPPLHWSNGTLYARNPSTGRCTGISSPALAAAPGVYQVVPGNGITAMPRTGGGEAPHPWPSGAVGLLVLLAGAAVQAWSRRSHLTPPHRN